MKRKTLLIMAATAGVAVLAFTQISNAANSNTDAASSATPTASAAPAGKDPAKCDFRGGPHGPRGMFGRHGKDGPRGEGAREGGPLANLNLSDEQKVKVKAVMEKARPKIEAIRAEEQKKIQAVLDEAQAEIRPSLSAEQQQVLDDTKKLRESMQKLRKDAAALKKSE